MSKRKERGDQLCVVFADELYGAFLRAYEIPGDPEVTPDWVTPEVLNGMGRQLWHTQLSADEVAGILHECGAPEPWANFAACVAAGTILEPAPSPLLIRAQASLHELRHSLTQMIEEMTVAQAGIPTNQREFLSAIRSGLLKSVSTNQEQIERFLAALTDAPDLLEPATEVTGSSVPWHFHALFLFVRYGEIVGSFSPSANGPAVRFVEAMLNGLKIGGVSRPAIENVLRRGVREARPAATRIARLK